MCNISIGMASIDSSAPETTSSDNSPTLVRRNNFSSVGGGTSAPVHHAGPGSDSGSSHSDSVDSSSSGCKQSNQHQQQQQQSRTTLRSQPRETEWYVCVVVRGDLSRHAISWQAYYWIDSDVELQFLWCEICLKHVAMECEA
jgi:hypothetical protein